MPFEFEGKEMQPIFVFAKCWSSIHSKVVRLDKQAQQREKSHSHTNKLLDAEKAEKLIKIYRFYRAEEDNQ